MKYHFLIFMIFLSVSALAQQEHEMEELNSDLIEELSALTETETEDDYEAQQLLHYKKSPLNLNGPAEKLKEFPLFHALHIVNLVQYRAILGKLIAIHELQAVPGFDEHLIRKILPYVTVTDHQLRVGDINKRMKNGEHTVIVRSKFVPEAADGFTTDVPGQRFQGSRYSLLYRYKYRYRKLLEFGFAGEKDPGEPLPLNRFPFKMDFNSFHLMIRDAGPIKSVIAGDYTVNLGQGLIHWQSQAYKKTSAVINVKRQSEVIRPYQSVGEFNFHRGLATTIALRHWQATLFASFRRLAANTGEHPAFGNVITSFINSGLHRTAGEIKNKNSVSLKTIGANLRWRSKSFQGSVNVIANRYSEPILKRNEPYNRYAISGRDWHNYSVDYHYTTRNFHFFGEIAADKQADLAAVSGLLTSLHRALDVALLFRNISSAYQSVFGNAFTENTLPNNERGFYFGCALKAGTAWKLDVYADLFSFPWLKYRVDAPTSGFQYLLQVTFKPGKNCDVYSRIRHKMRPLNLQTDEPADFPGDHHLVNWRTQVNFQVSKSILLRNRVETSNFRTVIDPTERGYLFFTDIVYKPAQKQFSMSMRFQRFETAGYDTRIYAYENDLQLVSSTPAFHGAGTRLYINFRKNLLLPVLPTWRMSFSLKVARTYFNEQTTIGSGPSTIHGTHVTDVKMQLFLRSQR